MLIHVLLCVLSVAAVCAAYTVFSALSFWWLPFLLIGGYVLFAVLELTGLLLFSCFVRKTAPSKSRRCFYRIVSHTAEWVVLLCGTRVHIDGPEKLPKEQAFLLVSNHLSNLDPLVTMAALRDVDLAFVSKPENFKIPLAGPIMRRACFLPIDRENPRNAVSTIKQAAQQVKEWGLCMGIYPEGTRNRSGRGLLPFHNGSFKIATTAKCPIAVLTLRYEKGRFLHSRYAHLRVIEILETDYVCENRTDIITERVLALMKNNLSD